MKKIALFALAALCVSAAQAISTSWTADTTGATISTDGKFAAKEGVAFKTSFSIACVFDYSALESNTGVLIGATAVGASGTGPSLFMNTDGTIMGKMYTVNTVPGYSDDVTVVTGGQFLNHGKVDFSSLLYDGQNNAALTVNIDGQTVTYALIINGTRVLTAAHTSMTYTNGYQQLAVIGDAYYMEGIATNEDIASLPTSGNLIVPEPTALALLALGVAGLALKRKVA